MGNWQSIDTAPTDGTEFQGWGCELTDAGDRMEAEDCWHPVCWYSTKRNRFEALIDSPYEAAKMRWATLTHWMPTPSEPTR